MPILGILLGTYVPPTIVSLNGTTNGTEQVMDLYTVPDQAEPAYINCKVKIWNTSSRKFAIWNLTFYAGRSGSTSLGFADASYMTSTDSEYFSSSNLEAAITGNVCRLVVKSTAPTGCAVKVEVQRT